MLGIVDYGLIAVFFILLFGFVLLIARTPPEEQAASVEQAHAQISLKPQKHVIEYGIIAALLGFFLFLTVIIERNNTQ